MNKKKKKQSLFPVCVFVSTLIKIYVDDHNSLFKIVLEDDKAPFVRIKTF